MTDRNDILRACEERTGDLTQLLVAADWFAEHDEPDMERALRWMAKWVRHPHPIDHSKDHGHPMRWMWTCFGGIREGIPHATLPRRLCQRLGFWEWRCYLEWELAVDELGVALAAGDVDCVGNPTQCDQESIEIINRQAQETAEFLRREGLI